jgi:hypothetical protein
VLATQIFLDSGDHEIRSGADYVMIIWSDFEMGRPPLSLLHAHEVGLPTG